MKFKNVSILLLVFLLLTLIILLTACNNSKKYISQNTEISIKLSNDEKSKLSKIDSSLCKNKNVLKLKEMGYLDDFIEILTTKHDEARKESIFEQKKELDNLGLSAKETVYDLGIKAQKYLDKYYNGIKIGSNDFKSLVKTYIYDETSGVAKKAKEDSEFGVLYAYMCLYSEDVIDNPSNEKTLKIGEDLRKKTLLQICEKDFERGFKETQSKIVLDEYLKSKGLKDTNQKSPTTKKYI